MNMSSLSKPVVAAALAMLGWLPAQGMAQDASLAAYRCFLGDTSQCRPSAQKPDVRVEKQIVLGPYARYLAYLGEDEAIAAAKAQAIGEHAVERTVRITKRKVSEIEKYERVRGASTAPDFIEQTLSEVAVDARDQRIVAALRQ